MEGNRLQCMSRFTRFMAAENGLDLEAWAFLPGMLFAAPVKWWGDRGKRALPHEGTDFCFYTDRSGRVLHLGAGARVPVMYEGVVVRIIDDFLGRSVVVAHGPSGTGAPPLFTVYGHTVPLTGLVAGAVVEAGDVIATIASAGRTNGLVVPHLHVSAGTLSGLVSPDNLDWKNMNEALVLSDPLELIADHYRLIEHA